MKRSAFACFCWIVNVLATSVWLTLPQLESLFRMSWRNVYPKKLFLWLLKEFT